MRERTSLPAAPPGRFAPRVGFERRGLRRRVLAAAPLVVVALIFARVTWSWLLPAALLALIVASVALTPRLVARTGAQSAIALVSATIGWIASVLLARPDAWQGALGSSWHRVVSVALVVAATRLFLIDPWGGPKITLALGLVALIGCGGTSSGAIYPIGLAAFLALAFAWLREASFASPSWRRLDARRRLAGVFALGFAFALATTAALGAARAHDWAVLQIMRALEGELTTGFTDELELGSLEGLQSNDEIVMRVFGARTDYLRGVVFGRYTEGHWATESVTQNLVDTPPRADAPTSERSPSTTEVRRVLGRGGPSRYFLPLGARSVATSDGASLGDALGLFRPRSRQGSEVVWFDHDDARASDSAIAVHPSPPSDRDTRMPIALRKPIGAIAHAWTDGLATNEEKARAIERRLETEYGYSLEHEHERGIDPTLEFLTKVKSGHCEYFASAMALLARSLGIPARVVGGYRVTEHNDVGGYDVVRERDAHAWVELWIAGVGGTGSWRTFDPTPASATDTSARKTPWFAAWLDATYDLRGRIRAWASRMDPDQIVLVASLALLAVLLPIQWMRRGKKNATDKRGRDAEAARALHSIDALLTRLAEIGAVRPASEPIERFAKRLGSIDRLPRADDASDLLLRYARLRYGGEGDAEALARDAEAWIASVRRVPRAT